jgi:hypothetical protein
LGNFYGSDEQHLILPGSTAGLPDQPIYLVDQRFQHWPGSLWEVGEQAEKGSLFRASNLGRGGADNLFPPLLADSDQLGLFGNRFGQDQNNVRLPSQDCVLLLLEKVEKGTMFLQLLAQRSSHRF